MGMMTIGCNIWLHLKCKRNIELHIHCNITLVTPLIPVVSIIKHTPCLLLHNTQINSSFDNIYFSQCTDMCSQSSTSNITLSEITISNATVTWSESFGTEDPFFIVKHREHNSGVFESSEVVSTSMTCLTKR